MTLYCDSSALFKVYVLEPHTEDVRRLVGSASVVVTSVIAFVEIRTALGRLHHERRLPKDVLAVAKEQLENDWASFVLISPTADLLRVAADLGERHALLALDAIHLASFQQVLERADDDVEFSSFDERLNKAAKKLR